MNYPYNCTEGESSVKNPIKNLDKKRFYVLLI